MTPELWQAIQDKLHAALNMDPAARAAFVAELRRSDPEMCRELQSLIDAHEQAGTGFLELPETATLSSPSHTSGLFRGKRLGPFQILDPIGAGGMAEVYRAFRADDQYRQEVAIKVVRAGQDSGFVISHFRNERQILASLDHPNIARLLDGGTTEQGLPYFVMELIEGVPIDHYCNGNQLSVVDRLRLFLKVCSAVQYAHQRLIVHRDIKPGNILVTSQAVPKLLDFGIAKILDVGAFAGPFEPTLTVCRVLTPGYASPEQVKGESITTASDIYCLGVVLYELLTGQHPHRRIDTSPQEIVRAVCEEEPTRPSTAVRRPPPGKNLPPGAPPRLSFGPRDGSPDKLSKRLRGDLDNVILMALRKEPQRRYATVEQFAQDIRRHLDSLPVIARKDTVGYRAAKFVARHRAGVLAAAAVAFVLLVALAATIREARIARQQAEVARLQRARAERRFNDVRRLAHSMIFEIHDSIRDLSGATQARKLLVSRALEYLDQLSQESSGDSSLQRELAEAYDRVGQVLGYTGAADLGDYAGASRSYAKALAIREALAASHPADAQLQTELWDNYFRLAYLQKDQGDYSAALQTLHRAQTLVERIAAGRTDPPLQDRLAGIYWLTGEVLGSTGDVPGALRNYRQGASLREPIAAGPHAPLAFRTHLIADYNGVAKMLGRSGQMADALAMSSKALALNQELSQANPASATLREYLAESYGMRADLLLAKGNVPGALKLNFHRRVLFKQLADADPSNMLARGNVAGSDLSIGEILLHQGRTTPAIRHFHAAAAMLQSPSGSSPPWFSSELQQSYSDLGMAHAALAMGAASLKNQARDWAAARAWFEKALAFAGQSPNNSGDAAGIRRQIARCNARLARLNPPSP